MSKYYRDGRKAAAKGKTIDACPHEEGTPASDDWLEGWYDYREEIDSHNEQELINESNRSDYKDMW